MIPDAIFLRLAAGFAKPTPEELVVLQQQQQVLFEEGTTLSLHELALQSGFLSDTEAAEFLAVAGGEPGEAPSPSPPAAGGAKAPSGRTAKAPSGRAKAPSGRTVKAPSGRTGVKAPSGRTGAPGGRTGAPSGRAGTPSGRAGATGRLAQRGASGRQPAPKKSPVIPLLLGAVVVGCVAGAVLLSRTPPSDGGGTAEVQPDADAPKTAEDFLGRARELHASVGARLRDGEGERVLQEVQALRREWTSIPAAKAALGELEELERDLQDELERLRAGQREDDPPPTSGDADDEDERELDLPPPPQPPVVPEEEPEDEPEDDVEGPADPPPARVDGERPQVPSVPLQDPVLQGTGPLVLDPEDPTLEPSDPVVVGDTPTPRPSGPAAGKDPVASDPDVAEPGSRTDPVLPDEVSPDYDRALIAFVKDDDAELERLSAKLSGAKDPLEGAARGWSPSEPGASSRPTSCSSPSWASTAGPATRSCGRGCSWASSTRCARTCSRTPRTWTRCCRSWSSGPSPAPTPTRRGRWSGSAPRATTGS
ncbi:MAG: hypothetical protein R3F62_16670 [Planctomycetota bacterium]